MGIPQLRRQNGVLGGVAFEPSRKASEKMLTASYRGAEKLSNAAERWVGSDRSGNIDPLVREDFFRLHFRGGRFCIQNLTK